MKTLLLSALTLLACGATAAPLYSVTDLGTLSGAANPRSLAFGVNELGQVTGYSNVSPNTNHAFRYTPGVGMVDLGTLRTNSQSFGYGINAAGQVAGASPSSGANYAVRFTPGSGAQDLGNLGTFNTEARAINAAGQVAGSSLVPGQSFHAFRYTDGTGLQDLGTLGGTLSQGYGINAGGQVVGVSTTANGSTHAFRYTDGAGMLDLGALQPGTQSYANGINDAGQVTGYYRISSGGYKAYLYTDGDTILKMIGSLPNSAYTIGNDVNNLGQVVGSSGNSVPVEGRAFLYTAAGGILDLNGLLDVSGTGWTLNTATSISENGFITGYGINPSGQTHAFLLTPQAVPEPSAVAALGLGLAIWFRRRRR